MGKDPQEVAEFYAKLKSELEKTTVFPSEYLYKFILPATLVVDGHTTLSRQTGEVQTWPLTTAQH